MKRCSVRYPRSYRTKIINFLVLACITFSLCACSTAYHKRRSFSPLQQAHYKNFSVIRTEMAIRGLELGSPLLVRAFKSEMELEVWALNKYTGRYDLFKTYPICKKSGTLGPKIQEGDQQTPEGFYYTTAERMNPNSKYHLSFNIGYPNDYDRALGRTGSALMIHGGCESEGCLAMNNKNIGEIYIMLDETFKRDVEQIPIQIFPFRMTPENMALRANSQWIPFWENLKQGYDYFEINRVPPIIGVKNERYTYTDFSSI